MQRRRPNGHEPIRNVGAEPERGIGSISIVTAAQSEDGLRRLPLEHQDGPSSTTRPRHDHVAGKLYPRRDVQLPPWQHDHAATRESHIVNGLLDRRPHVLAGALWQRHGDVGAPHGGQRLLGAVITAVAEVGEAVAPRADNARPGDRLPLRGANSIRGVISLGRGGVAHCAKVDGQDDSCKSQSHGVTHCSGGARVPGKSGAKNAKGFQFDEGNQRETSPRRWWTAREKGQSFPPQEISTGQQNA